MNLLKLSMFPNPEYIHQRFILSRLCLLILSTLFLPRLEAFTRVPLTKKYFIPTYLNRISRKNGELDSSRLIQGTLGTYAGGETQLFESFVDKVSFYLSSAFGDDWQKGSNEDSEITEKRRFKKDELLQLIQSTPQNAPTSVELTEQILTLVSDLENYCPTPNEDVLMELVGNWELLWTAQDRSSPQLQNNGSGFFSTWINPLENQSYSNNPTKKLSKNITAKPAQSSGRSNPILPRQLQDRLEQLRILEAESSKKESNTIDNYSENDKQTAVRSSQAINLKKKQVRNVVSVQIPRKIPFLSNASSNSSKKLSGSLTVDVSFEPNKIDRRKIDVKFDSCRVIFQNLLDITLPLGPIGPTGWLRTVYIDDNIRITRGHKGSVFILNRTSQRPSNKQ